MTDEELAGGIVEGAETPATTPVEPEWKSAIQEMQLSFSKQLEGITSQFTEALSHFNPVPNQSQEPTIDNVSDEELEDVVARGQGGAKIRKMVRAEIAGLKRQFIDPLEQVGLGAIANLTEQVTAAGMPHYKRFEKDMKARLASLPPASRLNPDVHKWVYNAIVGEHMSELETEAAEAAVRKTREPVQAQGSGSGRQAGGVAGSSGIPSVAEAFGVDADAALRQIGRTPDAQYQRMGYKNYADYLDKCKEYLGN